MPPKAPKATKARKVAAPDRRILRTREALRGALMQQLVAVGWDAMDVQTLCERANVGRSTFYQHFNNKEELLVSGLADLQNMLEQQTATAPPTTPTQVGLRFVPGLLDHVFESQEVFRAVVGRRSAQFVQDRFREMVVTLVLKERLPASDQPWHSKAKAHCIAGALMELMVWWLSVKRVHKPQEVAALFALWTAPLLTPPA